MTTPNPLKSIARHILIAVLFSGALLGILAAPARAARRLAAPPEDSHYLGIDWVATSIWTAIITGAVIALALLAWLVVRRVKRQRASKASAAGVAISAEAGAPAPEEGVESPEAESAAGLAETAPDSTGAGDAGPAAAEPESATPAAAFEPVGEDTLVHAIPAGPVAAEASQPPELEAPLPEPPPAAAETAETNPVRLPGLSGESKLCRQCGETIMAEACFCPFCAARIQEISPAGQACPQCRQLIPWEAQFCPFCGARIGMPPIAPTAVKRTEIPTQPVLPAVRQTDAPARPAAAYPLPKGKNYWPVILLGVGALVVLCCLAAVVIGWWQKENIPLLSGLLGQPTATRTPRPTRTARPTATRQPPTTRRPTFTPLPTEPPIVIVPPTAARLIDKLCLLPAGSIHDGGFNALAWSGLQSAAAQYGADSTYVETRTYTDQEFRTAIDRLVPQGCDLIVGVGMLTAEAIRQTAAIYPQQKFLLLDAALEPPLRNVWSQTYATDQGAFLAGYLAAAVSRSGSVATFGGMDIPVVRTYMNGFAAGVSYYNANEGRNVQMLGWDIYNQTGIFSNDFNNPQQGQILAKQLFNQGADILFPVAGLTGYGAAAEASTRGSTYIIGVDNDWVVAKPEYAAVMLTSVEKRLDVSIYLAAAAIGANSFQGGNHLGTLATEVTLAPYHNLDQLVPNSIRRQLEQVNADIVAGKINTQYPSGPANKPAEPQELTIWMFDTRSPHIDRWVAKYQAANPMVKITVEAVPYADILNQWAVSVAAGTGPDLLLNSNSSQFTEMARSGQMLPLDDLLAGKLAGFTSSSIRNVTVDGRLYGIPYRSGSWVLYYNKSLLPEPPETLAELASLVRQGQNITIFQSPAYLFSFFTAYGGLLVDPDGRCIADQSAGVVEGLKYLQALSRDGAIITTDWSSYSDQFREGQAAMTIDGTFMVNDLRQLLGDNLGVALIPPGTTTSAPLNYVGAFLVNPNSRNPELAVDLALYFANPAAQIDLDNYMLTVRTDLNLPTDDPTWVLIQAFESGFPDMLLTKNFYGPFDTMLNNVLVYGTDPVSALRQACEEMNRLNGK